MYIFFIADCPNKHLNNILQSTTTDQIEGWTITCNRGVWHQSNISQQHSDKCNNWWGFRSGKIPEGSIKTTFIGNGQAKLDFGNCYEYGTVTVYLDGRPRLTAFGNTTSKIFSFDFHDGSVLEIKENGIIQFNSLEVIGCSKYVR